jgi:hypothetical protein
MARELGDELPPNYCDILGVSYPGSFKVQPSNFLLLDKKKTPVPPNEITISNIFHFAFANELRPLNLSFSFEGMMFLFHQNVWPHFRNLLR